MNAADGFGGVPLGRQAVILRERRLILPGSVELHDGGLSAAGCSHHLRVIDVVNGVAWFTPCTRQMLDALHTRAGRALAGDSVTGE